MRVPPAQPCASRCSCSCARQGSGSASANTMFAKTVFRMGVPVSPKNIFPSNIQGLPTWYEVRVSEKGYLARRDGIDLMVAMNPQTYREDLAEIVSGGWLLYDSTMQRQWPREDIQVLPVPIAAMCAEKWTDPRQRQLFKNIIYVGALSALLDIDTAEIERLFSEQYKGKEALLQSNIKALRLGRDYATTHFSCPLAIRVQRANAVGNRVFVDGNSAAALGALFGGATVCAWYPITPSSSLAEAFSRYCYKYRVDPATGKPAPYGSVGVDINCAVIGFTEKAPKANLAEPALNSQFPPR